MIKFRHKGNFNNTEKLLNKLLKKEYLNLLDEYAQKGLVALANNTPSDSGLTAASWTYEIGIGFGQTTISWLNTNINDGVNIALILQLGHGTGTGGYVAGRDYINPAIQPVFDQIANAVWKEVTSV